MDRKDLVGKNALICFREGGKYEQIYGRVTAFDEVSISVRTEENSLVIPTRVIEKIKLKQGELDEYGSIVSKKIGKVGYDGKRAV